MPGRLILSTPLRSVAKASGISTKAMLAYTPRYNIQPGQDIAVLTQNGMYSMRWGIIPVGRKNARGRPVTETIVNARSETVFSKTAFKGMTRAVVPANGWYEWTGEKRRKQPWCIRPKDSGLIWFAAIYDIWNGPGGVTLPQVATITCEPNADVQHVHHRMGVLLSSEAIPKWLNPDDTVAQSVVIQPKSGNLVVEIADDVNWQLP